MISARLTLRILLLTTTMILGTTLARGESVTVQIKHFKGESVRYYPGDIATLIIQVWPVDKEFQTVFTNMLKGPVFKNLYIVEVLKNEFSSNNFEVLEVKVNAVVLNSKNEFLDRSIVVNGQRIPVKYQKISFVIDKTKMLKKFFIFKQPLERVFRVSKTVIILMVITSLCLMLIVGRVINIYIKRRSEIKLKAQCFKEAKNILEGADNRMKIEQVYSKQQIWIPYSTNESDASLLLNGIQNIMYNREWDNKTLNQLSADCKHIGNGLEEL